MFQSGFNRKCDSKSLDACVRIEVLLGTNGDRPGNNSFRSVPTSLLYFLKSRGDPFSLCTYTRKYIQDFLFPCSRLSNRSLINRDLKKRRNNKAFFMTDDRLQTYRRNSIRFHQNEKKITYKALVTVALKKNSRLSTIFQDFISIF